MAMLDEETRIWLTTTRTAAVVRFFVERNPGAVVLHDRKVVSDQLDAWCTNRVLAGLIDFSVRVDGLDVLVFHDDSRGMWASMDQLQTVEELCSKKLLRFKVHRLY